MGLATVESKQSPLKETFPRRKREIADTGPPNPQILPVYTSFLPSPLHAKGQLHLLREREGQEINPRDLAAALGEQQQWKAGRTCPFLPRTPLCGRPGATAVPFSRNDPNRVFGNKRLQLYLNAFLQLVNSHPWAPG